VIICTFVLSALPFDRMENAIAKMTTCLNAGGDIFFRDYGRYDMSQLRFKEMFYFFIYTILKNN
jgi:tRNAThr (cytosine32-N3)-methyltransferase